MFETRFPQRITAHAANSPTRQHDYADCWKGWRSGSIRTGRSDCYRRHSGFIAARCPGMTMNSRQDQIVPHPNDPALRSFISVDPASDFPIQNLPYGVFSTAAAPAPRVGVAIGDHVLDLAVLESEGLIDLAPAFDVFVQGSINAFMALGPTVWSRTRARISELLRTTMRICATTRSCAPARWCRWRRQGCICRSRSPAIPISIPRRSTPPMSASCSAARTTRCSRTGCTCRSATTAGPRPSWVSGTRVRRPRGQLKPPGAEVPSFGPCKRLDFELEMGVVVGQPSAMGGC